MNNAENELSELLREKAEHAEPHADAKPQPGTVSQQRRARSTVHSMRLTQDEQLNSALQSIYEMLSSIDTTQKHHDNRLIEMDRKLDHVLELLEGGQA